MTNQCSGLIFGTNGIGFGTTARNWGLPRNKIRNTDPRGCSLGVHACRLREGCPIVETIVALGAFVVF